MGDLLRAYNDQASVDCVGFAVDADVETLVLLDVVGHKTACKSIWATVVGGQRKPFHISGPSASVRACGGQVKHDKYAAFWTELPEQNAHNLVICHSRLLDAATDPADPRDFYLTATERIATNAQSRADAAWPADANLAATASRASEAPEATSASPVIMRRFAAMLNQALDIPVLAHWAGPLWDTGLDAGLIAALTCGGDIAEAYRALPDGERWARIVADAFAARVIHILTRH